MKEYTGKVDVVFRRWPDGDVLALFPYVAADTQRRFCSSYERVGQHGAADYHGCIACTRPAAPEEYAGLQRELEQIGYSLRVRRRARSENLCRWY